MNYKELNDFELISYAREMNEEANELLYKKYRPVIVAYSSKMFRYVKNCGLELNDLIQEGMLGLNQAIQTFDSEKDTLFYTYASRCIERKIITAVTKANRQKNRILNNSLSLEIDEEQDKNFDWLLTDNSLNPENMIISDEFQTELIDMINEVLTEFERKVFELKMNHFDYQEIASILDKNVKAIDNALQRIKQKIRKRLENK